MPADKATHFTFHNTADDTWGLGAFLLGIVGFVFVLGFGELVPPKSKIAAFSLAVGLVVGAVGLGFIAYSVAVRRRTVTVDKDALVVSFAGRTTVALWADVVAVYGAIPLRSNGRPEVHGPCRLRLKTGRVVRVPTSMRHPDVLADRIHTATEPRLRPALEAALDRGEDVEFGPVWLHAEGVRAAGRFVPWKQFAGFGFPAGEVELHVADGWWAKVALDHFPNAHLFVVLARTFARAAGFEVQCFGPLFRMSFASLDASPEPEPEPAPAYTGASFVGSALAPPDEVAAVEPAALAPPDVATMPPPRVPPVKVSVHRLTWKAHLGYMVGPTSVCLGAGAVALLFAVIGTVSTLVHDHDDIPWIPLYPVPAVLLFVAAYVFARRAAMDVVLSMGGIMMDRRGRTTQRSWNELNEVYIEETLTNGTARAASCRLVFADGTRLTVDLAITNYDAFRDTVRAIVLALKLPVARRAIAAGEEVRFGAVALSAKGIEVGKNYLAWRGVDRARIGNGHLLVQSTEARVFECPLMDVANDLVVLNLIHDRIGDRFEHE